MRRSKARTAVLATLFALAACGESEPVPPVKRVGLGDVANAVARLFEKPKPPPVAIPAQPLPAPEPMLTPAPAPVVAAPVDQPPPSAAKPKRKPQWQKKKTKAGVADGVAGYSCATVRLAGSVAAVERMAKARGDVVTAQTRRQIQACFNQG